MRWSRAGTAPTSPGIATIRATPPPTTSHRHPDGARSHPNPMLPRYDPSPDRAGAVVHNPRQWAATSATDVARWPGTCHSSRMEDTSRHARLRVGAQGRVVLPADLRAALGFVEGSTVVAYIEGEGRLVIE